ncbi:phospholipase D family protein [Pseudomonas sp.]|uniref:phospholipase D family protein n=1 Tax=Pseudomonas sp. TaxID=306 RepID=UPI0031D74330
MELILLPNKETNSLSLEKIYHRALTQSKELYIVSAYLTDWSIDEQVGSQCKHFLFIIGKDFGITRKQACRKVLNWLPPKRQSQFMVAESISGFHPKAIFWRELDGKCFALLGSSNLTKAAFSTNREANGYAELTEKRFAEAKAWIDDIYSASVTLDEPWLERYREAVQPPKTSVSSSSRTKSNEHVFDLEIPDVDTLKGVNGTLEQRRTQMRYFKKNKAALEELFRKASRARIWPFERNEEFYAELNSLWYFGDGGSRFQGKGWDRHGRYSDFQEFSKSLVRVLDTDFAERDAMVAEQINRMTDLRLPTRGALFSEMLCQFFPRRYHVLNGPVRGWLAGTGITNPRGAGRGERYINSARLLRAALHRAEGYPADNLAELDSIIWLAANQDKVTRD